MTLSLIGRTAGSAASAATALMFVGLLAFPALAEVGADCENISSDREHKIVISQVKGIKSIESEIQRERVLSAINMQLPLVQSTLKQFVKSVLCDKRQPSSKSFDRALSDLMTEYGVVLEVWGEVDQEGSLLHYAVVPIRSYEHFAKANPDLTGLYLAEYGPRARQGASDELRSLFSENRELSAFATLALGARHLRRAIGPATEQLKTTNYDLARGFYCSAVAFFKESRQAGLRGLRDNQWSALLKYAEQSALSTTVQARADSGYGGAMKFLKQEQLERCPQS